MKEKLLEILRCPHSGKPLVLSNCVRENEEVLTGELVSADGIHRYPIVNGVPRFAPHSNYADNFGLQWNKFSKTQLDSCSGTSISADRFWRATGWSAEDMRGQWVLDAGCGSGRFCEIVTATGANVVAIDYSSAVDACYVNLIRQPNLNVVQADIYALPFAAASFSFVYSLGVLQHTPDVRRAYGALVSMAAPKAKICVDFYRKSLAGLLQPKYLLRPLTTRMEKHTLFELLRRAVPSLLAVSIMLRKLPMGRTLSRLVPVANYDGILPLDLTALREWALLDTFDWLSPAYDNPQTAVTVENWARQNGLENVVTLMAGHLVLRGSVPNEKNHTPSTADKTALVS